jgi:hypothetical protein
MQAFMPGASPPLVKKPMRLAEEIFFSDKILSLLSLWLQVWKKIPDDALHEDTEIPRF